jgi:hypothetical protein
VELWEDQAWVRVRRLACCSHLAESVPVLVTIVPKCVGNLRARSRGSSFWHFLSATLRHGLATAWSGPRDAGSRKQRLGRNRIAMATDLCSRSVATEEH